MTIWQMSLWASVIILATVIIRSLALHKIPKNTFLVLWGLVLVRLLIPFQFHIALPFEMPDIPIITSNPVINTQTQNTLETQTANTADIATTIPWAILIWAVVAVGLILYFVVSHLRYRKAYKLAIPIENKYVVEWQLLNTLKRRTVKIKVSADISAPLTYGLFQPIILMPKTTDWENNERLRYILTHEMTHIRRFDTLWKWLLMLAACVHWFNPFVWVMYVLANRDLEITCDERVVRTLGENNKATYALTLIDLAKEQAKIIPLGNAFSKNAIEERTVSIMKTKKVTMIGAIVAVVAIISLMAITAFAANAGAKDSTMAITAFAANAGAKDSTPGYCVVIDTELKEGHEEYDVYGNNNVIYFDTQDELTAHLQVLFARIENGISGYALYDGFEDMYANIDLDAPIIGYFSREGMQERPVEDDGTDFMRPTIYFLSE